ncbi:MAG TPA: PAS domain S-box protein [Acidobacteriaceae bacterium]|nr:PAS domain S-box protein [Acidobacteriaceae bacterium]
MGDYVQDVRNDELSRNLRRWEALLSTTSYSTYSMSPDWSEMRQLTGAGFLRDTQQSDRNWLEKYIDPADQPEVLRRIAESVASETIFEMEHRVRLADGSLGWTLSRAVPVRRSDGAIEEWFGMASDVTEQHARAKRLAELASIVESSDDVIVSKDLNGIIASWNAAAVKLFGYEPAEIIGKSILTLIPEHLHSDEPKIIGEIRAGRKVEHFETWRRKKSGELIEVSLTISPVRNEHGVVVGASKILRDITGRRRRERYLAFLVEISQELISVQELVSVMDAAAAMGSLGERIGEYFGASQVTFAEVNEPQGLVTVSHEWRKEEARSLRGEHRIAEYGGAEFRRACRAGETFVVQDASADTRVNGASLTELGIGSFLSVPMLRDGRWLFQLTIFDAAPRVWREDELDVLREVTARIWATLERVRAEEALAASERQHRMLFDSVDEGVCIIERLPLRADGRRDYRYVAMNPAMLVIFHIPDLTGQSIRDNFPDEVESWYDDYDLVLETGQSIRFERATEPQGMVLEMFVTRVRDSSGKRLLVVMQDITKRKQAEQALEEQQERLRKVEKLAAAGQLAASLAHEINNPLSSVTNALYLLEVDPDLHASARTYVAMAASELKRVSHIVKQSLSYYRVDKVPGSVSLAQIVRDSMLVYGEKLLRNEIRMEERIFAEATVLGFPNELRQVVDNLVLNASQAMTRGGKLIVSVQDSHDWTRGARRRKGVRLTIADTGCGISPENRRRLFEPFFTTKADKGTGLGLWVLRGIMTKHEGTIRIRSCDAPGKSGTVVSLFLPSTARA